jgi:hypothetical protein
MGSVLPPSRTHRVQYRERERKPLAELVRLRTLPEQKEG